MENFRNKIRKNLYVSVILALISIAGIVLLTVFGKNNDGFNATSGFFGGMLAVSSCNVIKIRKALRDEKVFKQMYIAKTDERNIRIEREASATMFNITLIALSAATVVSNFFSSTVSSTLSVCIAFIFITYTAVSVYYNKKL
ncbi:MAG: hypothetical protein IIZ53_06965 [Ruminococcus sp.]|nr:hypothetical protein [Ruminococcus sp.]